MTSRNNGGDHSGLIPLAALCGQPMPPGLFLKVATAVAAALADLHAKGQVQENLNPDAILVDPDIFAVTLPTAGKEPAPPYMSPEQTGRLNLPLDHRSDLYSLGVIYYEMLTGSLPCEAEDLLEWVHCHIAHAPRPLQEVVPEIPGPLSDLVMKLLAKDPQERYQTAAGVRWDLDRLLSQWEERGLLEPIPLGEKDLQSRLVVPQKLYGREKELALLTEAFAEVRESARQELVMVAGYSGIGKSSLVQSLRQTVLRERGYFASGKFDQYRRNIPYSTIADAFRHLVRQLLSESEERVAQWRKALRSALGISGQLIVDIVPELELIIGKQPEVPVIPPSEADRRFKLFFRRFVSVFAGPEHPLVLFLDDLQWPDPGTLKLLGDLAFHDEVPYLLVIGAYRDNEVSPSHPLMLLLADLETSAPPPRTVVLAPLSLEDLGQLLADTLKAEAGSVAPLTRLVQEKTGGNPFFVLQFIQALYREGLIRFDSTRVAWTWDIEGIRDKGYTDNIADLMAAKLKKLPERTLHVIELAACIGNAFDLRTLAMASQLSERETREALKETIEEGLVLETEAGYLFVHDRIQEAAYSLVPEQDRPALHLRIGRLLLAQLSDDGLEERILDVVNQLNGGVPLIEAEAERERVAELNFRAARRSRAATAYASALEFAEVATALLPSDAWERRYDLAFNLDLLHGECEYLAGNLEGARERLTRLFRRARPSADKADVTCVLIDLFTTQDRSDHAVEAGLEYLHSAGVEWPPHPGEAQLRQEFDRLWERLGDREIEELLDLPQIRDPEGRAVMDVLARMLPPALFTDGNLFGLGVCRLVDLSLEHGNSDASCLGYLWIGLLLSANFGEYRRAYRFGKVGLDLVEQRGLERYRARVYLEWCHLATPWNLALRSGPPLVVRALETALERGDLTFAAYSSCNLISALLAAPVPLAEVQEEAERRLLFCRKARFGMIAGIIAAQLGMIRMLRGLTVRPGSFDSHAPGNGSLDFDQAGYERHLAEDPAMAVARSWYWVRKLQGSFLFSDIAASRHAAQKMKEVLWTMPSHLEMVEYVFFDALTCCARYRDAGPEERKVLLEEVEAHRDQFRSWEGYRPENFADRSALLSAERERILGNSLEAEQLYEQALYLAREQGLVYNEALICELASRFYRVRGFRIFADVYLCYAVSAYRHWGADGKVGQLEQEFPVLKERATHGAMGDVDAITVVKASQAISREILHTRLLDALMRIVLENAGARKGVLALVRGEISVEAEASLLQEEIAVTLAPAPPPEELFPVSVANFVRRTGEKIILEDASEPNMFSADPYLKQRKILSLLCLPVVRQAELVGLLYLENDLVKGAFTGNRIAILDALAAQIAISLENARLYEAFRELSGNLEARVREAVEELDQKNRAMVLQSRQAIMGEMLGNIAHQWRQPLNTLALLAQELRMTQKFDTLTKESLEANVAKTMEIIQHMSKTIDDFRYFFRPEKEQVSFRLLSVLEKALSLLEGTFHAYNISVQTVASADPVLEGFPNEYSQVLLNLLNNSKDAFLARQVSDPSIVITVSAQRGRSVVTIADNAGGIPEEILDKIFDLYFTTKGPEQGTGVGLFMCKSIIEKNMHGSLTVRNTERGAEFRIEV
jgi:predicted ATPase/signal transduction histidine kinase